MYAHTISDGKLRWKADFVPANRQQQGGTWIETSPAVAYGKVFVVGDGNISAFNAATGELVWAKLVEHVGGTTVAVADGTVLVNGSLLLDSDHGHLLWKAPNDLQAFGTPVVVDGHFYVVTGDRLVAWSGSVPGEPIE